MKGVKNIDTARVGRLGTGAVVTGLVLVIGVFVWMLARPSESAQHPVRTTPQSRAGWPLAPGSAHSGGPAAGRGGPGGLRGSGYSVSGGASGGSVHHVVLTVHSAAPTKEIGYLVPTSRKHPYGKVMDPGRSWRLATTAYGKPDYARVWIAGGSAGTPVICTITVDGRVSDQRSTSGAYGASMCQG